MSEGDPRPDLPGSDDWIRLLASCVLRYGAGPLEGVLRGFRCLGAELVPGATGYRLQSGEYPEDEWDGDRETYLLPFRVELTRLLRAL